MTPYRRRAPCPREKPAFWIESIFELDLAALAARGVRGVLFDVDNTLVAPLGESMAPALATHLLRERQRAGIERWALASNSRRDLTSIARAIEADVVRARWPIVKPRATYFHRALALLGMPADSVAMVGDKLLHDIEPASRLGMHTVLVHPLAQDQLIDRLMLRRQRERTARKRIEGRGDQTHAPSARPNQAPISKLLPCGAWRASACSPAAATARG